MTGLLAACVLWFALAGHVTAQAPSIKEEDALAFVEGCWLPALRAQSTPALLKCYGDKLPKFSRATRDEPSSNQSVADLLKSHSAFFGPRSSYLLKWFESKGTLLGGSPGVALEFHRWNGERAETGTVFLQLQQGLRGFSINEESWYVNLVIEGAERASYRQLTDTDWLGHAHVHGRNHNLQLLLQRPAMPRWGLAIKAFLATQDIACTQEETDGDCPNAHWSYGEDPQGGGTEKDPCVRRKILLWALRQGNPADLLPSLPMLLQLVRNGAMDRNADLATTILQLVPPGDQGVGWPVVEVLLPQQRPDLGLRMAELDRHLRGLPDERLRQLVAAGHVYEGLLRALVARPLSPPIRTALLEALSKGAHRILRLAILDKLATEPAAPLRITLQNTAANDLDCYVRGRAAALLASLGDPSFLPAGVAHSDAQMQDQLCQATADTDPTRRNARLRALVLPGAVLVHFSVNPDEDGNPNSPVAHTKRSPLTVPNLLVAATYLMNFRTKHEGGVSHESWDARGTHQSLEIVDDPMEDDSYKITMGQRRGRRGVARVYRNEDHVSHSCY